MQRLETKSSSPRPKSFETETRRETFETETSKNWSRDASRDWDQVSRLHRWYIQPYNHQEGATPFHCYPDTTQISTFAYSASLHFRDVKLIFTEGYNGF